MQQILIVVSALGLGLASAAFAQDSQQSQGTPATEQPGADQKVTRFGGQDGDAGVDVIREYQKPFVSADQNNDGVISRSEAQQNAWLASAFDEADADGNGELSTFEYELATEHLEQQQARGQDTIEGGQPGS